MSVKESRTRSVHWHYDAELEGLRITISSATNLLLPDFPDTLHVLADNLAAASDPIKRRPSPGHFMRLAIRSLLNDLAKTHRNACVVLRWVWGHVGVG